MRQTLNNAVQTLTIRLQRVRMFVALTLNALRVFVRDVRTLSARLNAIDARLNDNENAIDSVERKIVERDDVQDMIDDATRDFVTSDDVESAIEDEISKIDDRLSDVERDKQDAEDAITESDVERMIEDASENSDLHTAIEDLQARIEALEQAREQQTADKDAARDALRATIDAAQEALNALDQ